jgi:hypothetical protein
MSNINTLQFNKLIDSGDNLFVIQCSGGLGNNIGGFFSGLDYYIKFELNKSHKLVVVSVADDSGDFILSDFFDFNDKIYYRDCRIGDSWGDGLNLAEFRQFPHPYNHMNDTTCNKDRLLWYLTNQLYITSKDHIHKAIQLFSLTIKQNIIQPIKEIILKNNINKNTLGIHYRTTDLQSSSANLKCILSLLEKQGKAGTYMCQHRSISTHPTFNTLRKWLNISQIMIPKYHFETPIESKKEYDNIFICSDNPEFENNCASKFGAIIIQKKHKVVKKKGYENYDWSLNYDPTQPDNKQISIWYNVYRSKEQCIEGFIDCYILGYCSISVINDLTTFGVLGIFLNQLFPID